MACAGIAPGNPARDGLPWPARAWALCAIWLTVGLAVMDGAIANVALPAIASDLGASPASSIWVINAYQLSVTMLLLPIASAGEIHDHRRVYQAGVIAFVAASAFCGISNSLPALASARFLQGVGAAAIMAVNGALVRVTFPRAMLGRGLGYNAVLAATASAAGPTVAAITLSLASWRWLFLLNIPVGLLALAIGYKHLPSTARHARSFDWASALLTTFTFGTVFLAAIDITHGNLTVRTTALMLSGASATWYLMRRSRRDQNPLVPLDLLRIPILRLSYATSVCAFAAQTGGLVALPFFLQNERSVDQAHAGLMITALPLGLAIVAPIAGRLGDRVSSAQLGCVGLCGLATSYLGLTLFGETADLPALIFLIGACGVGFGIFQAPNNRTMLTVSPEHRSGAAAGMLAMSRLCGQMLGAMMTATLFRFAGTTSSGPFLAAAGLGALAAGFSIMRLKAGD